MKTPAVRRGSAPPDTSMLDRRNSCLPDELTETLTSLLEVSRARAAAEERSAAAFESIAETLTELKPLVDVIHGVGDRLDKLCAWLKKWGPWMLASTPFVLTAVGAMSPNAAEGLSEVLKALAAVFVAGAAG